MRAVAQSSERLTPAAPPAALSRDNVITEKIESYSVYIGQTGCLPWDRIIRLRLEPEWLESGYYAVYIGFAEKRPSTWLELKPTYANVLMPVSQYADVYHVLQSESPVFFTASTYGWPVAAVHTELDLSAGEPPGEGDRDHPQTLEALMLRIKRHEESAPE